jgi:HlyD family secretion protein
VKYKLVVPIAVVVVLAVVSYFLFLRKGTPEYTFRLDRVSTGDITMFVTATGIVNAMVSVDVGTQVSGIVSHLYADFNSVVKEGQVIAQIDSTFLVQAVRDAEGGLSRTESQRADSKRALDREQLLVDKGLDAQMNLDAASTTYKSNDASVKQSEAALERAKINLAYATIYAPISGVVTDRKVSVGQTVAASFSSPTLYTIANDLTKMQLLTTVDESDIGRISAGQGASFMVDAYPDESFTGTVSQVRLAPVSVQNVVNYTVVIGVNNDQLKLMPGMTATVKILLATAHDVMRVPSLALRFQPPADVIDTADGSNQQRSLASGDSTVPSDSSSTRRSSSNGGPQNAMRDIANPNLQPLAVVTPPETSPPGPTRFGITQSFPQFEKSVYTPSHQSGQGRVWVVESNNKLRPVYVLTGVSDGKFTEVTSSELKAQSQIVVGIASSAIAAVAQSASPLTSGAQQRSQGARTR